MSTKRAGDMLLRSLVIHTPQASETVAVILSPELLYDGKRPTVWVMKSTHSLSHPNIIETHHYNTSKFAIKPHSLTSPHFAHNTNFKKV